jgi:hypothetical protein
MSVSLPVQERLNPRGRYRWMRSTTCARTKSTRAWRGVVIVRRDGRAMVRTPPKELLEQLDGGQFVRVHRSVVVNLEAISHARRKAALLTR